MAWERVYTVNEFWDGARLGIADCNGLPHIYQSPFDYDADEYADFYLVSPISPDLLDLVLEDWRIWIRWSEAFERRATTRDTHPALPEDRDRHEDIVQNIGNRLKVDPASGKKLKANFRNVRLGWEGIEVEWSEV